MRLLRLSSGQALLCLCFLANLTTVGALAAEKRDESDASASNSPSQTSIGKGTTTAILRASSTSSTSLDDETPPGRFSSTSSFASPTHTSLPKPTISPNNTLFNATLPEGQLPLKPEITPGWAVAGAILLITGVAYTLIGIRANRVHAFFSTAFLAGLGTTVLILYLTTLPVSHAVQGAFVVAAVCTGAVFGGLAVVFKDIAECLGCLLGGFCLSMWLLTLQPGGLVTQVTAKLVFIAAFTFTGFGLYFSRWTRTYGLIGCMAFSGATAVVLGIDCFSRAGLREFWAYIWDLNDRLFPLGTVTYPLTRSIRVELAVIVLIFLIGIISQLQLWRLIKNRRKQNGEEQAERDPDAPDDEETIGRRVEETTNRERREWERIYGDGASQSPVELPPDSELPSPASGKMPAVETIVPKDVGDEKGAARAVEDGAGQEGPADSAVEGVNEGNSPSKRSSASIRSESQPVPEASTSPPPLNLFVAEERDIPPAAAPADADDRSSVVAVVDDNDGNGSSAPDIPDVQIRGSSSDNLTQRMSGSSTAFRWSYSQQSMQNKRDNWDSSPRSREALVETARGTRDDDVDSIVATLDGTNPIADEDISERDWSSRRHGMEERKSLESAASLQVARTVLLRSPLLGMSASADEFQPKPVEMAKAVIISVSALEGPPAPTVTTDPRLSGGTELTTETKSVMRRSRSDDVLTRSNNAASLKDVVAPSVGAPESAASFKAALARLTEGNLPPALPPVALTYRMNEWAKHLGAAETPEPEALQAHETTDPISDSPVEEPAHLDIMELQLTAENATRPPAIPRTSSTLSNHARHHRRVGSKTSLFSQSEMTGLSPPSTSVSGPPPGHKGHRRSVSTVLKGLFAEPIAEESDGEHRSNSAPRRTENSPEEQLVTAAGHAPTKLSLCPSSLDLLQQSSPDTTAYPAKSQTLIGMREALLRTRASGIFTRLAGDSAHIPTEPTTVSPPGPVPDVGSPRSSDFPVLPTTALLAQSPRTPEAEFDDLPLSHRRAIIRRTSVLSMTSPTAAAESVAFDSHQLPRRSAVPPEAIRQARLANFRNSVVADLAAASPGPGQVQGQGQGLGSGPGSPSIRCVSPIPGMTPIPNMLNILGPSPSMTSLHLHYPGAAAGGGAGIPSGTGAGANGYVPEPRGDVLRSIELQRSILLEQKEAEAQRREAEMLGKQQYQREFEERMRSGALMGRHRDAMRRMQGGVRVG